jgi:serine/threonine protein kinase
MATESSLSATGTGEIPSLARVAAAFPQLEILELIGRGAMGFVFKARQPHLDRFVALKLLPDKLARDPQFTERFNREGRVLAKLNHPNIVSVFDFGPTEHFYYLMMEFVDGVNLRQAMQAGRFSPSEALAIVPKICEALQYAHEQGVLHRDIKPENILLDAKGRVKIADFGIAKLVGEDPASARLTGTGAALGTPHYMAPEQLEKPSEVDHRADIYSLGVVFYEMLTGELPLGRFAAPSKKTPLDERVDEIVLRALAKEKELRQQSAGEVKTQVEGVSSTMSKVAREPSPKPVPLAPLPVSIPTHIKPVLLVGLVILLGLLLRESIPAVGIQFGMLWSAMRSGVVEAVIAGAGLVGTAWLAVKAWQKRDLLLPPRGLSADLSVEPPGQRAWAGDSWLRLALIGVVACLGFRMSIHLLGSIITLAQMLGSGQVRQSSLLVIWLTVILLPMALMVRRDMRRTDLVPPAPAPGWMLRFSILLVALGIISCLPSSIWNWRVSVEGNPVAVVEYSFNSNIFLLATAMALLTRSRLWRAIAIPLNAWLLLTALPGHAWFLSRVTSGQLPAEWTTGFGMPGAMPVSLFWMGLFGLLGLSGSLAGLIALMLPGARAAFGLKPRSSTSGDHASGGHRVLGSGSSTLSLKAVWSAALVGLSLVMPLTVGMALLTGRGGIGPGELWLSLGSVALPGLAGTLAGWLALNEIRNGRGAVRGVPLALFATLTWPMLALGYATIGLPMFVLVPGGGSSWAYLLGRVLVLLLPASVLTFALWAIYTTARWTSGQPIARRGGVLTWVFAGVLVCGLGFVLVSRPDGSVSENDGRWPSERGAPPERKQDIEVRLLRQRAAGLAGVKLKHAELNLESARKQFENGKLTQLELHTAEAERDIAKIELDEAMKLEAGGAPTPEDARATKAAAADRLQSARLRLQGVEKKIELGELPPQGREILEAKAEVAIAEATLGEDVLAMAKTRFEYATQMRVLVEKLREVGKATPEELNQARLTESQAGAILTALKTTR